jgi:hypothetical protein
MIFHIYKPFYVFFLGAMKEKQKVCGVRQLGVVT